MKIDRLIGILSILLQKDSVTAPDLAERFEVSRRTINRDIEALCMAGIPLVTRQGQGGGISIMDGYKVDRTLLSTTELKAILAGLQSLDSVCGTNRYAQLMEKLSVGSSNLLAGDSHILIDLACWQKASLAPKIEQLHHAILSARKVSFTYHAPKGESHRLIEPYDLLFQWSSWYVWSYCLERQDYRLFKLNRMTHLQTEEGFEKRSAPLPDLSPEKVFPAAYQVTVRIDAAYKWRLLEEYGPYSFTEQSDGSLIISSGFTDKDSIICWVTSFGEGAELLEPAELREELLDFVERMREKYKKEYKRFKHDR